MQHDPLPERGREVDEARQPTGSKNVRASTANPATRAHPGGVTAWRVGKAIIAFAAALVIYLGGRAALDWRSEKLADDRADEIVTLMRIPPQSDFHHTMDAVRMFINDHSQDKVDAVFRAMNGQ
jgi:hypothetical protein